MRRELGILVAASLALSARARADSTVNVVLTPQGQTIEQGLGDAPGELIQSVQAKINSLYQLENIDALLKAFGDATAAADRGLGIDYATHAGELVFGIVATGVDAGGPQLGGSKVSAGELLNLGIFAGASLARWGLPHISVFANGYYETETVDQLTGHLTTLGGHVQWRAIESRGVGAVRWIGLDLTTGVEYAHDAVGAEQPLLEHFTLQGDAPGASTNFALTAAGTLSLVSRATTIPVIATTGVRLGPFDVYGGGGVDFEFGSTTLTASLDGNLSVTSDGTPVGTVAITASGTYTPTVAVLRALAGVQLDLRYFHAYLQYDVSQTASAASLGLRAVFR